MASAKVLSIEPGLPILCVVMNNNSQYENAEFVDLSRKHSFFLTFPSPCGNSNALCEPRFAYLPMIEAHEYWRWRVQRRLMLAIIGEQVLSDERMKI